MSVLRGLREVAALRDLMTAAVADGCGGELYVQPIAVPFGLSPQVYQEARELALRKRSVKIWSDKQERDEPAQN
ncbi:hypothetical protein [Brevibacillus sp. SAFN-007a]|uniref:hypothetical protein n=1 Tax=Brevibacillus sp. SAFN-007a TaxID=3436862 RepID=UPI003F820516